MASKPTLKVVGALTPELAERLARTGFELDVFSDPLDVEAEAIEGLSPVLFCDVGRYAAKGVVRGLQRDTQATKRFFINDPLARDEAGTDTSEQELRALTDFSQAVSRSLAKAEIVDAAARYLHQQCASPALALHYWSPEEGLQLARAIGLAREPLAALEAWLAPQVRLDNLAFRQGLNAARMDPPPPFRVDAVVPILAKDALLGVLSVALNPHFNLSIDTLKAMGRQLALSLQNGELLARSEQALASLQRAQESMTTSEKLAAVGLLAAGIAHEINNPTAFIITNLTVLGDYAADLLAYTDALETLVREGGDTAALQRLEAAKEAHDIEYLRGDTPELLARSLKGMHRIQDIVVDLKSFAHRGQGREEWVDVNQTIAQVLKLAGAELRHRANVELDLRPVPSLHLESTRLTQVLLNLIINAYQAFGDRPKSENMVWVRSSQSDGGVCIAVADNGPGMSEDVKNRIFEPFFTTKPVGTGSGLGLAVSYELVKKMGGQIRVETTRGRGTRFSVELPVREG